MRYAPNARFHQLYVFGIQRELYLCLAGGGIGCFFSSRTNIIVVALCGFALITIVGLLLIWYHRVHQSATVTPADVAAAKAQEAETESQRKKTLKRYKSKGSKTKSRSAHRSTLFVPVTAAPIASPGPVTTPSRTSTRNKRTRKRT